MRESRDQSVSLGPQHLCFHRPESPVLLSQVCPFLSGVCMPSTMLLTPPFSKSLHCQVCSCLSEQVPGVEYKPHPCLQSAGVKRNYCCSLLGWAWRNYPKAVFIMPLNLVPVFNVLSTLTPGVSLLRCSFPQPSYSLWLGGSSLTSVLLVFICIKSWIGDCLFAHLSKLTLVLLQPRSLPCHFLLSQESIVVSGFQVLMKKKDAMDGPACEGPAFIWSCY